MATPDRSGPRSQDGGRFCEIDVFRGIAALWVVYYHYVFRYRVIYDLPADSSLWFSLPGLPERDLGFFPVYWFFVISGFVISWTLEKSRHWHDFAISRFSRLYPTYWTACALTFLVGLAAPLANQHYTFGQFLVNLTMIHKIFGVRAIDGVYWSLQVELVFYLVMGVLFATGGLRRIHEFCLLWIGAGLLRIGLERAGFDTRSDIPFHDLLIYGHFFIAGIIFYQIRERRRLRFSYALIGLCLFSFLLSYAPPTALACGGVLGLFELAVRGRLAGLVNRPLLWLGAIAYPLYVCHQMLGYRIMTTAADWGWSADRSALLALLLVVPLAWGLNRAVEQPVMSAIRAAWKRRQSARLAIAAGD